MLSRLNTTSNKDNTLSFNRGNSAFVNVFGNKPLTSTLSFIKSNPILEIAGLDLFTMILPRTYIDSKQNPDYGIETFIREAAPVPFNPFGPTIVAGILLSSIGLKEVTAGEGTIKGIHKIWQDSGGDKFPAKATNARKKQLEIAEKYADSLLSKVEGGTQLTESQRKRLSKILAKTTVENYSEKRVSKICKALAHKFVKLTGAEENLAIKHGDVTLHTDAHSLFKDAIYVPKKVLTQHAPGKELNSTLEGLFKFVKNKSALAIGITLLGYTSLPFINNSLTKARTGSSAYCAYQDFKSIKTDPEKDKKTNWKLWGDKALGVLGIGAIAALSMGGLKKGKVKAENGFLRGGGLKDFKNKIALKGAHADRNILRFIYACAIASRILFARDSQEVKVTEMRDYASFLNWLVLGGVVSNGIAYAMDESRSFVNIKGPIKGKTPLHTAFNWIGNVSQKTYGEAASMCQHMGKTEKMKTMAKHNAATLGGLLFSSAMLGFAMPKINNYMTNRARAKQIQEQNRRIANSQNAYGQNAFKNNESSLYADFFARRKKMHA